MGGSPKTMQEKLDSAKAKAAQQQYAVTITELLKKTITVMANDRFEAEQKVSDDWRDSMYILGADDFHSVDFEAVPAKHDVSLSGNKKGGVAI